MLSLGWLFSVATGQIVINEFCASNSSVVIDPDYDEYADWLELYNTDVQTWNLKGFYVTDNLDSPDKWQIPIDLILDPGEFAIIWADGSGTGLHTTFKISASGEELGLFSPEKKLIDSVSFGIQNADISYGRIDDGAGEWAYFTVPTPGSTNNTTPFEDIAYEVPSFSLRGGFYNGTQIVELNSQFGGIIRYTTDGAEPTGSSSMYTSPIHMSGTTVLRARVFKTNMVPGPVLTQSYFIDENSVGGKLPVVSIATDPDNFWDPDIGIYTQDFKPEWEIPVNIELFENNGLERAGFNQKAGIKVNGLYSWQLPQKMLGVYFKKAYGDGNLAYTVTPQRDRHSYKSFALRASGSDWSYTLFRDILGQESTLYNMDIDIMGFKPSIVYVNGDYLGIHNIREKVDADYIETSYGLEPGSFDLVENQDFPEAGDLDAYNHLLDLLKANLAVQSNFDAVAELVDIENCTDMVITEMATRNTSISHNVMAWKPKTGGKWRWVMMDLDRGFFDAGSRFIDFYLSQDELLLDELFQNDGYREYFADRLAAQLFTTFNPQRMIGLIDAHESIIEDEVPRHIARWQGTTSSYGNAIPSMTYWRNEVNDLRVFVGERPTALLANLVDYDFLDIATLILGSWPLDAGKLEIEGLKTAGPLSHGPWILNRTIDISAYDRPGYNFTGWYKLAGTEVIPAGSVWKYNDLGINLGTAWIQPGYNDESWSSGPAQLGYGDDDENTVVGYGGSSSNKYITTYFRKSFNLSQSQVDNSLFYVSVLKDDGAVVYINGTEVARINLQTANLDYRTLAETGISSETEDIFYTYRIDNSLLVSGTNVIATEVHQDAANSSDMSFDLYLVRYSPGTGTLYSSSKNIQFLFEKDTYLEARYTSNGDCMLPEIIESDLTLSIDCSPYYANSDITIPNGVVLDIGPGVEIRMPGEANIFVNGELNMFGTNDQPVRITSDPESGRKPWGGIVFRNTPSPSSLQYVIIEDASEGPDPVIEYAAISAVNADLVLDHLTITDVYSNPIIARYSDIKLYNSTLQSDVTGDLINVKYGTATIENCHFTGNDKPDTDAIDYDEVENGIIRNCIMVDFHGSNSDAIDIGEVATNVMIDSIIVYDVTDKGVSIGQQSSATVRNCIFINTNMGVAVKDSSRASISNCIFYNNGYPLACYEKNIGLAGGNATVRNSIFSNFYEKSFMEDERSNVVVTYSLSDGMDPFEGLMNKQGDPGFNSPTFFDFTLLPNSPGIMSGKSKGGDPVNMGTELYPDGLIPSVMIVQFFVDGSNMGIPEFITLLNPSDERIDISGYMIDKGVTAVVPEGTFIGPEDRIVLTNDIYDDLWDYSNKRVVQWIAGQLSNNGESIRLTDRHGIVLDNFTYGMDGSWPNEGFSDMEVFVLKDPALDNHFGKNWSTSYISDALIASDVKHQQKLLRVYPNPTSGRVMIESDDPNISHADIFDIQGHHILRIEMDTFGSAEADLSAYGPGMYILRTGGVAQKIIVK